MPIPFSSRPLLALPLMAPLFGCADRPAERPIVLRPPQPERHLAHRPAPRRKQSTETASREAGTPARTEERQEEPPSGLSPSDKEALFRQFDDYLSRSGRQ